jgi:predicted ATPase
MRIHDEQSLAALPHLDDIRLFLAMNIMDVMQIAAFLANPNLFIVMNLRMLRWTVTHGVCQFSPTLFASYGMVLCILGQTAAASSMGMSPSASGFAACHTLNIRFASHRVSARRDHSHVVV